MLNARVRMALAGVVLAAGGFFAVFGARSYVQGRGLLERGAVVEATLTGIAHRGRDSDTGHQVRYRFRVGGRDYRRVGVFGTGVASDVSREALAAAVATGHLAVRYLPDDPSINEPVAHARPQKDKGLMAVGAGVFLLLVGLVRMGLALRARRDEVQAAGG